MPQVKFEIQAPEAKEVLLVGDFNEWDREGIKLRKKRKRGDGVFGIQVNLEPGPHEFKYLVDGEWVCDREAPRVPNSYGTENSVCHVRESGRRTRREAAGA